MNTLNPSTAKVTYCPLANLTLLPSLHHHRQIFFRKPHSYRTPSLSLSYKPIHASALKPIINPQNHLPKFQFPNLKTTVVATVTATALLFSRLHFFAKPAIAVTPVSSPQAMENDIEEQLLSNPEDINALKTSMEIKIKNKKYPEAISVLNKLIELDPNEVEWPLLKSHLYVQDGEVEMAKNGFSEIISKDPFCVEAYHGLVMASSHENSIEDLKGVTEKIEEGIKLAKKENKTNDLRDFKLLIAQVKVMEGKYEEALKVYSELVNEEPRDFRPYLCQGIIYTLLRRNDEAEKSFEKYRKLVPKDHPYSNYFDDNMIATKEFAKKVEKERVAMKN